MDNTTLNPGASGDSIRTVAKTATSAKTQAMLLDVGGGSDSSPELILAAGQTTKANSIPMVPASDYTPPQSIGTASLATGQGTASTTASIGIAQRTGRASVTLYVLTGTLLIGAGGVASGTGKSVPAGSSITLQTQAAIYVITVSGSATFDFVELY